jgi:two-component system LytT family response regulator
MTHRCLIIEDDIYTANNVKEIITTSFKNIELLKPVESVKDAKIAIDTFLPNLIISDINLKDDVVFSLLKEYDIIPFKIIFITSYSKYAVEAFKFSALHFLEKPFEDQALIDAIKNALEIINLENYNKQIQTFFHNYNPEQKKKKLVLKNLEDIHIVSIENIIYLKSDNNYTEFYINDGRKIVMSKPLKSYDEQLQGYYFFRTHQSFLVNLNFAKIFHKKDFTLELSTSRQIPVSHNKAASLIHYLSKIS